MADAAKAPLDDGQTWLSVDEACRLLGVSRATFYRFLRRGEVPAHRLGGRLQFRRDDVLALRKPVDPSPAK